MFQNKEADFFSVAKNEIKKTVTTKSTGFYVGAAAMLITIAQAVLYAAFFKQTAFFDSLAVVLSVAGAVAFLLASLTTYSSPYAPVALAAADFVGLLAFIKATYMYLSDAFYGGFSLSALSSLGGGYISVFLLFLLSCVAANVAVYFKQNAVKSEKAKNEKEACDEE